jgi:hypothetical protein
MPKNSKNSEDELEFRPKHEYESEQKGTGGTR